MKKFFISAILGGVLIGGSAWAGCDPCICGNGGGLPPPTGCGYGPWKGHRQAPETFSTQVRAILGQEGVQEQLAANGGLAEVRSVESEDATVYEFTTLQGVKFGTTVSK